MHVNDVKYPQSVPKGRTLTDELVVDAHKSDGQACCHPQRHAQATQDILRWCFEFHVTDLQNKLLRGCASHLRYRRAPAA